MNRRGFLLALVGAATAGPKAIAGALKPKPLTTLNLGGSSADIYATMTELAYGGGRAGGYSTFANIRMLTIPTPNTWARDRYLAIPGIHPATSEIAAELGKIQNKGDNNNA